MNELKKFPDMVVENSLSNPLTLSLRTCICIDELIPAIDKAEDIFVQLAEIHNLQTFYFQHQNVVNAVRKFVSILNVDCFHIEMIVRGHFFKMNLAPIYPGEHIMDVPAYMTYLLYQF